MPRLAALPPATGRLLAPSDRSGSTTGPVAASGAAPFGVGFATVSEVSAVVRAVVRGIGGRLLLRRPLIGRELLLGGDCCCPPSAGYISFEVGLDSSGAGRSAARRLVAASASSAIARMTSAR